jgi:hypothetical protein
MTPWQLIPRCRDCGLPVDVSAVLPAGRGTVVAPAVVPAVVAPAVVPVVVVPAVVPVVVVPAVSASRISATAVSRDYGIISRILSRISFHASFALSFAGTATAIGMLSRMLSHISFPASFPGVFSGSVFFCPFFFSFYAPCSSIVCPDTQGKVSATVHLAINKPFILVHVLLLKAKICAIETVLASRQCVEAVLSDLGSQKITKSSRQVFICFTFCFFYSVTTPMLTWYIGQAVHIQFLLLFLKESLSVARDCG